MYYKDRVCVPDDNDLRKVKLEEAHSGSFAIHLGNTKMYQDLKMSLWWSGMKKDVSEFVTKCKEIKFTVNEDGVLYYKDRVCVPDDNDLRKAKLEEAHSGSFAIHPGNTKMYQDLKMSFWWSEMKKDVSEFVTKCLVCQRVKAEHQVPLGLLQPIKIPEWK